MGDANTMDEQQMRRELIASATADPAAFVDKVRENFTALTERISKADARIVELTATAEDQAALITELSLQKDQAKREADQLLSHARQEAAEIISDAKSQAKQLRAQAETKLLNANVEADSIKTTKLNAIRNDISTLESQRLTERDRTLGFLQKVSQEYETIIEQCSQTVAKLRTTRSYVLDQAKEIESTNFEHFDIDPYLPRRSYTSLDQIAAVPPMPATQPIVQQPVQPVQPVQQVQQPVQQVQQPVQQVQQPVQQVQQPVQQSGYVDNSGIIPAERSFNEMFQRNGQTAGQEYDAVDEFGDSGLLMEAMAGMETNQDDFDDFGQDDFGQDDFGQDDFGQDDFGQDDFGQDDYGDMVPSDSGLLFDALSSIDDVEEQRDIEEFSEMDDFDEFEDALPPEPSVKQRIKVPQRRRGNRSKNMGWNQ